MTQVLERMSDFHDPSPPPPRPPQPADRPATQAIDFDALPTLYRDRSFWGMTVTQFMGAFNDSVFKQLVLLLTAQVLVVSGDRDTITPPRDARALARLSAGKFVTVKGAGHIQHARKPVGFNLMLREFATTLYPRSRNDCATPAPMPCEAPVTITVFFLLAISASLAVVSKRETAHC